MSVLRMTASAGVLIRGNFISELKRYCWLHNYQIEVDEDKHFLDSEYRIRITVPDEKSQIVKATINNWIKRLETE